VHLTTLVAFVLLELALCLIPGPAVLSVVGAALGRGARAGFATALGILTGNLMYFIVSALGLASILVASHSAFTIVKWCGAGYLAYLGVRALLARPVDFSSELSVAEDISRRGWLNGMVVQLSNPKALVFFTAILPQFVDPKLDVAVQLAILGVAGLAVELGVLSFYIACAQRIRRRGLNARSQIWAERIGGAFLLAVAAVVAREAV
jgi:homoserine/homoserine lactone efflux protein